MKPNTARLIARPPYMLMTFLNYRIIDCAFPHVKNRRRGSEFACQNAFRVKVCVLMQPVRRSGMKKHSVSLIMTPATVFAFVILITSPAMSQGRGAQPPKPKPAVGAWWYKGDPQPPGPHPDLTGVWFGGSMNDISKDALPGEQVILTPLGAERYKRV